MLITDKRINLALRVIERGLSYAVDGGLKAARQNRNKRNSPWTQALRRGEFKEIVWVWIPGPWPKYVAAAIQHPDGSIDVTLL